MFWVRGSGARLTKNYDVTIQRYRESNTKIKVSKMHILRCMGSKYCVKFKRCSLKFHTKFWTHILQNIHFTQCLNFDELRYLRVTISLVLVRRAPERGVWVERFSSPGECTPIEETKRAAARTAVIIHREEIENKCHMGRDTLAYHASYYLTSI